jgi:hypothetical protein
MSTVLHLLAQDLRAHRRLLGVWVAVVVAHPLTTLLPWGRWSGSLLLLPAILIVIARIVLGAVVLGSILQQDSPIDDRAFGVRAPSRRRRWRPPSCCWPRCCSSCCRWWW